MRPSPTMGLALALWAAGCGDNLAAPGPEPGDECDHAAPVHPGTMVPGLADIPSDGCVPGALAGVDIRGLWYVQPVGNPAGMPKGPVRFHDRCGDLRATGDLYAEVTDDHLFWGYAWIHDSGYSGVTGRICRVEADGSLWGRRAWIQGLDEVVYGEFTARPFGLIPGEGQGDGLELVSEWAGPAGAAWPSFRAINVRVHERIAYLITQEGLRIVDVATPAAPRDLGFHASRRDSYNDVKIVEAAGGGVFAVLASNNLGVVVVDVSVPERPVEVRRFSPPAIAGRGTHTLFTQRVGDATHAYFVDGSTALLSTYDVTDPASPAAVSRFDGSAEGISAIGGFHDLYVEGDRAYVNATYGGFLVLDISDPRLPVIIGQTLERQTYSHSNWVTTAGGRRVAVHGGEGYGSFVRIIDVDEASPSFLQTIGEFRLREQVSVHNIMAVGERAYVAYYQNGVRVLDLSDPTQPRQIAHYNTWDPAIARGEFYEGAFGVDVDAERGLVYVADSESGLVILGETR